MANASYKSGLLFQCCAVVLLMGHVISQCPTDECDCVEHDEGRYNINCRIKGLDQIPIFKDSPMLFYEVNFGINNIQDVPANAFKPNRNASETALQIERIILTDNPIVNVDDQAFDGTENLLDHLELHVNDINTFPDKAINGLINLQTLELRGFKIAGLPDGALLNLTKLQTLRLSSCGLDTLTEQDLVGQTSSLVKMDLESNLFQAVPTAAITALNNLEHLILRSNRIVSLDDDAFDGAPKLSILDMAQNAMTHISNNAFRGLETILKNLDLNHCNLDDSDLTAIGGLLEMEILDLGYNDITDPSGRFLSLNKLLNLNLHANSLSHINKNMFEGLESSLHILRLAENNITIIDDNSFESFKVLKELELDEQDLSGTLNEASFRGLESSLNILNLKQTKFSTSTHWQAIEILRNLTMLTLSYNTIQEVPEFIFEDTTKLNILDMSYNLIHNLTQRMMEGLQKSLGNLNLNNNSISTIGNCTFYEFIELSLMNLHNNPLHCDCQLEWLREWLYNSDEFVDLVRWTCNSPPEHEGKFFKDLSVDDMICSDDVDFPPCEDFTITTTAATTSSPSRSLAVNVTDITDTTMVTHWNVDGDTADISGFRLDYWELENPLNNKSENHPASSRQSTIKDLSPSTDYRVCVLMLLSSTDYYDQLSTCTDATTEPESLPTTDDDDYLGIILGCVFGFLALVVIIGLVVFFYMRRKKQKESLDCESTDNGFPTQSEKIAMGYNSKRFRKSKPTASDDIENMDNVELEKKLAGLTPEERQRVINLLSTPAASTMSMISTTSGPRYVRELPHRPISMNMDGAYMNPLPKASIYEEIPDDTYDEIPAENYDEIPAANYI